MRFLLFDDVFLFGNAAFCHVIFPVPRVFAADAVCIGEEDGKQTENCQNPAIPHIRHHIHGSDAQPCIGEGSIGQGGCDQKLGAVGDDALEHTGEDIQQGSGASGVYLIFSAHILGDVAADDDGYGVVGCGAVGGGGQCGNANLGGTLPFHHLAKLFDEPYDTAVMGDHFGKAAAEQGQKEYFIHIGEACPDILGEGEDGQVSVEHTDDACTENTDDQHQKYVHACQSQHQYGNIGDDLNDAEGKIADLGDGTRLSNHQ